MSEENILRSSSNVNDNPAATNIDDSLTTNNNEDDMEIEELEEGELLLIKEFKEIYHNLLREKKKIAEELEELDGGNPTLTNPSTSTNLNMHPNRSSFNQVKNRNVILARTKIIELVKHAYGNMNYYVELLLQDPNFKQKIKNEQ